MAAKRQTRTKKPKKTPDMRKELRHMPAEPLLPVETKLIGWSLGLGAALLVVLVWATQTLSP